MADELENWERLLVCPDCGYEIVVGLDKIYPSGPLRCRDCTSDFEIKEGQKPPLWSATDDD